MFDDRFADNDGTTYGFFATGQVVFVSVIVVANLKIISFAFSFSLLLVVMMVLSASLGYVTWVVVNTFDQGKLEHTFKQ